MASKKRAKRKVDRSGQWRVTWLAAFLGCGLLGLVASPLTKPTQIRVTSAARHQEAEIRKVLGSIAETPGLLIDGGGLEARLLEMPDVRSASFRSNIFGRARLAIECREAVAVFGDSTGLDESGRAFHLGSRKQPNLHILSNVKDFNTIITITDASPINQLCRVAKKLQESLPKVVGTLDIDEKERIRLRIEDLVVEFGDTSNLDEKIGILASALKENPQRAQQGGSIILVDPEDPVQVR